MELSLPKPIHSPSGDHGFGENPRGFAQMNRPELDARAADIHAKDTSRRSQTAASWGARKLVPAASKR